MPFPLGAAIGAGAGLLGTFMSSRQQNKNVRRTNKANIDMAKYQHQQNMDMAKYAYDKDLEMWKLQNQYNSPAQQMKRFEEAGLSKHMIYGQGTPGNATGSPTFTPPNFERPTLDYSGIQDSAGKVLTAGIGQSAKMVDLANSYRDYQQNEINAWLAEETKNMKVSQEYSKTQEANWRALSARWRKDIDRIKRDFWNKGISPSDATWLRIGLRAVEQIPNAPDWLKNIFNDVPNQILNSIMTP